MISRRLTELNESSAGTQTTLNEPSALQETATTVSLYHVMSNVFTVYK